MALIMRLRRNPSIKNLYILKFIEVPWVVGNAEFGKDLCMIHRVISILFIISFVARISFCLYISCEGTVLIPVE